MTANKKRESYFAANEWKRHNYTALETPLNLSMFIRNTGPHGPEFHKGVCKPKLYEK